MNLFWVFKEEQELALGYDGRKGYSRKRDELYDVTGQESLVCRKLQV